MMAEAVRKVCALPADANRLRVVTFMTDGYIGNDFEVIDLVRKLRDDVHGFFRDDPLVEGGAVAEPLDRRGAIIEGDAVFCLGEEQPALDQDPGQRESGGEQCRERGKGGGKQ